MRDDAVAAVSRSRRPRKKTRVVTVGLLAASFVVTMFASSAAVAADETPATQAADLLLATVAGEKPDLPRVVTFRSADGGTRDADVEWDLEGYDFAGPFREYQVFGRTPAGASATATIYAIPAQTSYFVDSGAGASASPLFDAVKALLGDELRQDVPDRAFTSEAGWGFVPQAGTDGPIVCGPSKDTVVKDLYERILCSSTSNLDYTVTLPEAGTYTLTLGTSELWDNQYRRMAVSMIDAEGTVTPIDEDVALDKRGDRALVQGTVDVDSAGPITVRVSRAGPDGTMPQVAWFSLASGTVEQPDVDVEAPTITPAGEAVFSAPQEVTIASGTSQAVVYYTTDGSVPSPANGTRYEAPFTVSESTHLRAAAWRSGVTSQVTDARYTIIERDGPYTGVPVGEPWFDTQGRQIQAHGGGFLEHDGWYYWVGENKEHHGAAFLSVNLYRSKDLLNWEFVNQILTAESATGEDADRLATGEVKVERPKLLFNEATGKFVLWGHWETADSYSASRLVVATSDTVDGLYTYVDDFRPGEGDVWDYEQREAIQATVDSGEFESFEVAESAYEAAGNTRAGLQSRDFTVYQDPDTAEAYLVSAEAHHQLRIYPLSEDYLTADHKRSYPLFAGESREAAAVIKVDGVFYLLTSGQSGWYPNQLKYAYTDDLGRPDGWSENINVGNNTTFKSQPTYVMEISKTDGSGSSYVYMGDRWTPGALGNSTYVWLPLEIGGDQAHDVSLSFTKDWSLDVDSGELVVVGERLVSQGKPATASPGKASQAVDTGFRNEAGEPVLDGYTDPAILTAPAQAANDGIIDTTGRWDNTHFYQPTAEAPYWWQVDLQEPTNLSRVDISWRSYNGSETYSAYKLYGSQDGEEWKLIADQSDNRVVGFTSDDIQGTFRFVKVEVSGVTNDHNQQSAFWAAGLVEVAVYATSSDVRIAPTVQDRCLAGKPYLAVRVANEDSVPLDIEVVTPYGRKTFLGVERGANAYQSFAVRDVASGVVRVTARPTDPSDGRQSSREIEISELTCR